MDRRRFLTGAATTAVGWTLVGFAPSHADGHRPSGFPDVEIVRAVYQNWSKEIRIDDLWTCRPVDGAQVAAVATWAARHGWRVRARGAMHGWSPLLVTPKTDAASRVVLVDTSRLGQLQSVPGGIRAGAGANLLDVLSHLEADGLGLVSVPAVGDVTVGGMLAIGAHGAAIPVTDDPVGNYGSLSNAVRSLRAVVYDGARGRYVERSFDRSSPELASLACSLGRTIVTEATFDASPLENLRCRSFVDIPAAEMFGPPGAGGRTLSSYFDAAGRAEALWYPFTDNPWLKVWEVAPTKPLESRETDEPYNYPFSDNVPPEMADLATQLVTGNPQATPLFGQMVYAVSAAGLAATASFDLWGAAKNTQLYIKASTLRVREIGLAVLTSRPEVQRVVNQLAGWWKEMIDDAAMRGSYPVNMPLEIRASALDRGRRTTRPILTATSPDPTAPHMDVVLFSNVLMLTGTPDSDAFYAEYERRVRFELDPRIARLRPEWSKNFAYTPDGASRDQRALAHIREQFRSGRPGNRRWDAAARTFDRLDPAGVFGNSFLDRLFER